MNPINIKHLLQTTLSIFFIAFLSIGGCDIDFGGTGDDSGSGNGSITGNVTIQGVILNFAEFGEITVTASDNNIRLDRTTTDELGNFELEFRTTSENVDLEFEADSFDAEQPNVRVVGNSTTVLDITLQQNPILITIERWQVFQDTISLFNETNLTFIENMVEFNIEGNGGNCMFATGTSTINYQVKSISIIDCREGIRAQTDGSITLLADESIVIESTQDAIITLDNASIEIGQTTNPIDNTVVINSENQFGINAGGDSVVTINPENACSISGGNEAVNEFASGSVSTSTCTLSL
jgi:hypothetical protein